MDLNILKHYLRKDVQKEILKLSKDREVGVRFGENGYGKRPDILQYPGDITSLAQQGATSFHVSEERWLNPLELSPGMKKQEMDSLRKGWDLIIDIDTKFLEFSKITAYLIVEAFKFHNLKHYSLKYSGGNGIHVAIPFESFPPKIHNQETRLLFPESVKIVASYLKSLIKSHLSQKLLELNSINEMSESLNIPINDLQENNQFNPFAVVDIDPILISSRHLFRSVYSINEKSGRVSIPINPKNILSFNLKEAKIENIKVDYPFLDSEKITDPSASELLIQAFDWNKKNQPQNIIEPKKEIKDTIPKIAIKKEFFPPCIIKVLDGIKDDGRKRAVFMLLNFLRSVGWSYEDIEKELTEWNKKNYEPLRDNYILAQISWHKRQKKTILPPNCSNKVYYNDIECHSSDNLCNNIKNPVQYVKRKLYILSNKKEKKKK